MKRPDTLMTRELGSEVACHPIDTFTAQQNDTVILQALLRASLLRSTCAVVHTDALHILSATQQVNSLRSVVTLRSAWPRFLRFSPNLSGFHSADDLRADGTLYGPQKAIQGRGEQRYNSIPPSRSRCCCCWRRCLMRSWARRRAAALSR